MQNNALWDFTVRKFINFHNTQQHHGATCKKKILPSNDCIGDKFLEFHFKLSNINDNPMQEGQALNSFKKQSLISVANYL